MSTKILLLFALICIGKLASGTPVSQTQPSSRGLFAAELFKQISKDKLNQNVILSPISIQAAMAMVFMGADGETATELKNGLRLSSTDKEVVGQEFSDLLKERKGEAQLNMANKIYVNSGLELRSTYNDLLTKYFNSEAESVDFSQSEAAIENVNNWIAKATNDKITKVLQPGSVGGDTNAIIVNTIYFKGKWLFEFTNSSTTDKPFWVSQTESVNTKSMNQMNFIMYGEFPELDATGVELPYKNSDLSMLVLLPKKRDGLAELEEKLGSVALNELSLRMQKWVVVLDLPKFQAEFTTSVTDVLKSMGIQSVFKDNAKLSGIFETGSAAFSEVTHKAFINVNEAGSEAAASTLVKSRRTSPNRKTKYFDADHPFVYAIKSSDTVYFVGHVAKP